MLNLGTEVSLHSTFEFCVRLLYDPACLTKQVNSSEQTGYFSSTDRISKNSFILPRRLNRSASGACYRYNGRMEGGTVSCQSRLPLTTRVLHNGFKWRRCRCKLPPPRRAASSKAPTATNKYDFRIKGISLTHPNRQFLKSVDKGMVKVIKIPQEPELLSFCKVNLLPDSAGSPQ